MSDTVNDGGSIDSARAGKASRAGAKAARMIRVVRMIRLIRLVKLYKYFSANKKKEESASSEEESSEKSMTQESRLGAEVSDRTTKRVIVGILFMLIVIPLLQTDDFEYLNQLSLQMVFDRRIEYNSNRSAEVLQSWSFTENYFVNTTDCIYLEYVGFNDGQPNLGIIPIIRPQRNSMRAMEKTVMTIISSDELLKLSAEFDVSSQIEEAALLNLILTTFVIFLLAVGTLTFSHDVNNLVIIPIEKMVHLVREISANPLGNDQSLSSDDFKKMDDGMETTLLLQTISKIAGLMRVGFGEAGAEIISKNLDLSGETGSMNLLGRGHKIYSIFAFCDIRSFTDTTECLQEEVMLFVNRIAYILHGIVVQYDGAANKNIGDAFLLTWKVKPAKAAVEKLEFEHDYFADKALLSILKTRVLMRRHDEFICNFSSRALSALYERIPRYKCNIGCGLHFGWAIEGAIGSEKKIDATYISPHVNWSEFLESSTKDYGVPILMSAPFYRLLSPIAQQCCRQVDNIKKNDSNEVVGLFTFDADFDGIEASRSSSNFDIVEANPENSKLSKVSHRTSSRSTCLSQQSRTSLKRGRVTVVGKGHLKQKDGLQSTASASLGEAPDVTMPIFSVELWKHDSDLNLIRSHFSSSQRTAWESGFQAYISGDWKGACLEFQNVKKLAARSRDGPSSFLLALMEKSNFEAPEDWEGFHLIS